MTPREALEFQLTRIWERVLGVHPIGVKDNFFALGGHSLLAVRLLAHTEKMLGKSVPLSALFQGPTVEQLASILRQEGWSPPWSSLVVIQPQGSKPPFFCVHGHDGGAALAAHLGSDQPVYCLAPDLDGMESYTQVEDMAAHYLKDIRALRPEGPYFLGGYSLGGMIAFEMAHQLYAHGHEVALLALFEPTHPGAEKPKLTPMPRPQRVFRYLEAISALGPRERLLYLLQVVKQRSRRVKQEAEIGVKERLCRILLALGQPLPLRLRTFHRRRHLYRRLYPAAARTYKPRAYPGRVVLFRGSGSQPSSRSS